MGFPTFNCTPKITLPLNYDFYSFNPGDFEQLIQALFQKLLGNGSIVYGLGPDGGRELTFRGTASFGSPQEYHDGLWLLQAKFRSRDVHDHDQYDWVKTHFISEMRKFESGKYPVPDQYIFVTNAVLTPGYQKGGRDKIEALISHYYKIIPRIYVISYDELCILILNNADVRQAFEHLLLPGDKYAQILKLLQDQGIHRRVVLAEQEIRDFPVLHSYTTTLPTNPILTIDFGTSYSLCGIMSIRGNVELIPTVSGGILLPSIISFFKNGCYIVGNGTLRHINSTEVMTLAHIKRYLATERRFDVFGRMYCAEELATLIIKSLKTSAEEYYGYAFKKVVVAKPANFNLQQTRALREVFESAGFKVVRMLDEGTAAAHLFSSINIMMPKINRSKRFLVMDLGGGTFDLSLQDFGDGVFETKAVLGDNSLGGMDYDIAVLNIATQKIKTKYPQLRNINFNKYLQEAERIKKILSTVEIATFMITDYDQGDGNLSDIGITITRDEFRDCTSALNSQIMRCMADIVRIGNVPKETSGSRGTLDAIMLTGQGGKIFTVREVIHILFPDTTLIEDYMENAVCLGNTHHSGIIQGIIKDGLLLSVQNTGLAIKIKSISGHRLNRKANVFNMAPFPELNTMFGTLLEANTFIPMRETFELNVLIVSPDQSIFVIPIFEVTAKGTHFEEITTLKVPVITGQNNLEFMLVIDANHAITIIMTNFANDFSEEFSIG